MIKDLRLCFCDEKDIGLIRKKLIFFLDKMEKNLQDFLKKWFFELFDDMKVLLDKVVIEILKVVKYVKLGCLFGILFEIGINWNENIYKRLCKWLKKDCIGVVLVVVLFVIVF